MLEEVRTWLRSAIFNALFFSSTALLTLVGAPLLPFLSAHAVRVYARMWMRLVHMLLRGIVGLEVEIRGADRIPKGSVIFASKHQSALDTLVFHLVRTDVVYGLKRELAYLPIFSWYLARAGNIFLDRGGAAKALKSLLRGAKEAVARGCSIVIFPEGTRTPPGAPPDYKAGVAALYAALGVPVVPVALDTGRFWPRRSFVKRPGRAVVEFLDPIAPGLPRERFMAELERRIEERQRLLEAEALRGRSRDAAGRVIASVPGDEAR
ncbi:MAG: lysophospholipid acyltransferase family protein [Geminicoccaceae bacterium]|nr:1-acyl-sn-glycerol-3-phosphate acyltransferase [Geminicoccaceae bacterium]MDW8341652.1 lysophospholipid acyltransferase family protein [Geminicoccaceae bacterium]